MTRRGGPDGRHHASLYTAVYDDQSAALSDLDALEHLHHDEMLGDHDAAVVDKEEADG